MNGNNNNNSSSSSDTCAEIVKKATLASAEDISSVVENGEGENDEESPRRQSHSSNHSGTTASVNDLSTGDDDHCDREVNDARQPSCSKSCNAATIDVIVEGTSGDISGCCESEVSSSRTSASRCTQGQMQLVEWTKGFHSLVDEAPLLEATIVSSGRRSDCQHETGNGYGDDVADGRGGDAAVWKKCKEKQQKNGDAQSGVEAMAPCHWADLQLLAEGRRFVRRNFFAIFLAHFIGIAFLLTVRPIQAILLRTSALHKKENTLRRYVKLILYLKRFYESPEAIIKSSTECHNANENDDISYIHRLQRNAAKNFKVYVPPPWEDLKLTLEEQEIYQAVQEDTKQLDDQHGICTNTKILPKILFTVNPDVPMSQYDLVIIQQAFFGLIAQFPRIFGIYDKTDREGNLKGMQGFIHLWAVIGHIFGIEERFNLCLSQNFDPETNQLIFKQVFLFSFKTINESALRLWRSMTKGSSRYFFFFRTKAMMLFMCKDVAQLDNCKHLYSVMKPMEKFCYYFCKFLLDWVLWVPPFRVAFNYSLRLSIRICQYFLQRAKKHESKWDGAPSSICVIDTIKN